MGAGNVNVVLCGAKIYKPANLREHKGGWHGLKVTKCDPCGKVDMERFKLKLNKMKVHVSDGNECGHCGKEAKTGVNIKLHKMKVHISSEN